jgi:hypothetical protein
MHFIFLPLPLLPSTQSSRTLFLLSPSADDKPQFAFSFADLPDDTKKDEEPKVKKVEYTKKEFQTILNLQDSNEWLEGLRSDMVHPWWQRLWDNHLNKTRDRRV